MDDLFYIVLGYLSGSVLFARLAGRLVGKDITAGTLDGNPGTSNAFVRGGILCGTLTLLGDLAKGFLPVFLYVRHGAGAALPLVMAAPVLGHILPVFYRFRGGKGIAVSFGCFLGLLPVWMPLVSLAASFILFSVVVVITPNYHRTLLSFACAGCILVLGHAPSAQTAGFLAIATMVSLRLLASTEPKGKCEVHPVWRR